MLMKKLVLVLLFLMGVKCYGFTVRGDFENGSCEDVKIEGDTVNCSAKLYPVPGPELVTNNPHFEGKPSSIYFHCLVEGAKGRKLNFKVRYGGWWIFVVFISNDEGKTWKPLQGIRTNRISKENNDDKLLSFSIAIEGDKVHIASYIPSTLTDIDNLIQDISKTGYVKEEVVSHSVQKRPLKIIIITDSSVPDSKKKGVYVRGGVHACAELSGPHIIEGMARYLVSNDPVADRLRKEFIWLLVPIANIDAVYNGWGAGCNATGHHMNRPASQDIDPEEYGIRSYMENWLKDSNHKLYFSMDIHTGAAGIFGLVEYSGALSRHTHYNKFTEVLEMISNMYVKPHIFGTEKSYLNAEPETISGISDEYCLEDARRGYMRLDREEEIWVTRERLHREGMYIVKAIGESCMAGVNFGNLEGNLLDNDDKPIADAEIEIVASSNSTNIDIEGKPLSYKVKSDNKGKYVFKHISSGLYKLTANKIGFKSRTIDDICIRAGTWVSNTKIELETVAEYVSEINRAKLQSELKSKREQEQKQRAYEKYERQYEEARKCGVPEGYFVLIQAENFAGQGDGEVGGEVNIMPHAIRANAYGDSINEWNNRGQWLEYDFEVAQDGYYQIVFRYCLGVGGSLGRCSLKIDGEYPCDAAQRMEMPATIEEGMSVTDSWSNWKFYTLHWPEIVVEKKPFFVHMKAGKHKMRLETLSSGGLNLDYLVVAAPFMEVTREAVEKQK